MSIECRCRCTYEGNDHKTEERRDEEGKDDGRDRILAGTDSGSPINPHVRLGVSFCAASGKGYLTVPESTFYLKVGYMTRRSISTERRP
jgi:hypothetical protein